MGGTAYQAHAINVKSELKSAGDSHISLEWATINILFLLQLQIIWGHFFSNNLHGAFQIQGYKVSQNVTLTSICMKNLDVNKDLVKEIGFKKQFKP